MKKALYILLVGIIAVGSTTGCQKKRGCTDFYSDNYDPAAKEDDDTCIPTQLKFVGRYFGNGTIETGKDTLVPYNQIVIVVTDSTSGPDGLIFKIGNFDQPTALPLDALITGQHEMQVNRQTLDPFTYWGDGRVGERVLEIELTRVEKIEIPPLLPEDPPTFEYDTLYLNVYGIKELN